MSFVDFVTPAMNYAKEATIHDEKKNYEEAYKLYLKSIDFFMTAMKRMIILQYCNIFNR